MEKVMESHGISKAQKSTNPALEFTAFLISSREGNINKCYLVNVILSNALGETSMQSLDCDFKKDVAGKIYESNFLSPHCFCLFVGFCCFL